MEISLARIDALMPRSLDDIIRTNRDKMCAYLTTDAELAALRKPVAIRRITADVSAWAFVTFFAVKPRLPLVYLTGYNEQEQCSWMTSYIKAIDGDLVATNSGSLYRVVGDGTDAPDLLHICATLHKWGTGPMFGVPAIFY